ncbi:MAG: hypothetical protein E7434_06100 [Ruminococcaceae bacterium]|nr:hypothetical protein [Oscillospiraceae bacterium]
MFVSFENIGQVCATFHCDDGVAVGAPCSMSRTGTVGASDDEENFIGVVESIKNNYACVTVRGFVTLPYSGTTPGIGYCTLTGDGAGKIKVCVDGNSYLVAAVDTVNKTATILL